VELERRDYCAALAPSNRRHVDARLPTSLQRTGVGLFDSFTKDVVARSGGTEAEAVKPVRFLAKVS
jgi:hypothetical protein